MPGNWMG